MLKPFGECGPPPPPPPPLHPTIFESPVQLQKRPLEHYCTELVSFKLVVTALFMKLQG